MIVTFEYLYVGGVLLNDSLDTVDERAALSESEAT